MNQRLFFCAQAVGIEWAIFMLFAPLPYFCGIWLWIFIRSSYWTCDHLSLFQSVPCVDVAGVFKSTRSLLGAAWSTRENKSTTAKGKIGWSCNFNLCLTWLWGCSFCSAKALTWWLAHDALQRDPLGNARTIPVITGYYAFLCVCWQWSVRTSRKLSCMSVRLFIPS